MSQPDTAELYLDLMKRTLTYLVYGQETSVRVKRPRNFLKARVYDAIRRRNIIPMRAIQLDRESRINGRDLPATAYTMVGLKRLDNLHRCATNVLRDNIPGDFIEAGTWRGGAAIFLRAVLKAYGDEKRSVAVADSFAGLPEPNPGRFPADVGADFTDPLFAVPLEQVKLNFSRFGLLDEQVQFVEGWFKDTLPKLGNRSWSLIRLDGDLYESTMDSLKYLYPNLSPGGYIVIDDYGGVSCCREAVNDFRDIHNIKEQINEVDWTGVYWQKQTQEGNVVSGNGTQSVEVV